MSGTWTRRTLKPVGEGNPERDARQNEKRKEGRRKSGMSLGGMGRGLGGPFRKNLILQVP